MIIDKYLHSSHRCFNESVSLKEICINHYNRSSQHYNCYLATQRRSRIFMWTFQHL